MNTLHLDHPIEDALERFLLNHCPETELEDVESHVLACETCVIRLETLELQIAATKTALQNLEAAETVKRYAALFCPSCDVDFRLSRHRATTVAECRPLTMHLNATKAGPLSLSVEKIDSGRSKKGHGNAGPTRLKNTVDRSAVCSIH